MRKELTLLSTLGLVWALNLGACAGPELLVGENAAKGGSSGSGAGSNGVPSGSGGTGVTPGGGGSDASGTGGSAAAATGATGTAGPSDGSSARGGDAAAPSGGAGAMVGTVGGSSPGAESVTYFINHMRFPGPEPRCFPRPLSVDASGGVPCQVLPVSRIANGGACRCDGPGLSGPIEGAVRDTVIDYLWENGMCSKPSDPPCDCSPVPTSCDDECICSWDQAEGADRSACQNGQTPIDSSGWCYIDADQGVGDPTLVADCQPTQKRILSFYGEPPSDLAFFACALENPPHDVPPVAAPIGSPCLMGDEYFPAFNGYAPTDVTVDNRSAACASGVCISNHFRGRVSCPYGQDLDQAAEPQCFLPGSNDPVTVPVDSQLLAMPAAERVVCSCRCDGPGPGPFCACPDSMECSPLIRELGLPGNESVAGSYCIPRGTAYDSQAPYPPEGCDASLMNCGDPRPY